MFVGLLVTAGVAYFVQSNDQLLAFAADNFFILFIAQLGDGGRDQRRDQPDQRDRGAGCCSSSTPRRSGITIGLIVVRPTRRRRS